MIFWADVIDGELVYGTCLNEDVRVLVIKFHVLSCVHNLKCVSKIILIESSD